MNQGQGSHQAWPLGIATPAQDSAASSSMDT